MAPNSRLLEKEIEQAKEADEKDRFVMLGRKYVDYYIANEFDILLIDIVKEWDNPALAEYAISRMSSVSNEKRRLESTLEYAADIATAFGKEEQAKQLLERLLEYELKNPEFKSPAARTLVKLGRYDRAIDRYMKCNDGYLENALSIAKEHCPDRMEEVARKGFKNFKDINWFAEFYVECAEILGKKEQARKNLVKKARKEKVDSSPRLYNALVASLMKLGEEGEAREFVYKVAENEARVKKESNYYDFNRPEELAGLFHLIGEVQEVKYIYMERIDVRIRENHHPSNTMKDIDAAVRLTGDESFRKKKMRVFELQEEYDQAAALAMELGKDELAATYSRMQAMVNDARVESVG